MITDLPRPAQNGELVGIDTELFSMQKPHRADGTFACLSIAYLTGETYQIYDPADIAPALERLEAGTWCLQNALFDLRVLRRFAPVKRRYIHDTMLCEQDLFGGWFSRFSLDNLARRWLDIVLNKEVRERFGKAIEMTPEMKEYAARDALVTVQIAEEQREYIQKELGGNFKWYTEIDEPALWAILDMPPVRVDVDGWLKHAETVLIDAARMEEELGFNVYSHKTVKEKVEAILGRPIRGTNANEVLLPLAAKLGEEHPATKLIRCILEIRKLRKAAETYGEGWVEQHVEDGYIYPSWGVTGAETGRMSCIAAGSLVDAPRNLLLFPRGIPIESIREGQFVYSFDRHGIPVPRKVLKKTAMGTQKVLKLVWRGSGSKSYLGELKATADHRIRLIDGSYRRMDELRPQDQLSFLSRSMDDDGRAYLVWNKWTRKIYEHRHLVQTDGDQIVHHQNGLKWDNSLDNLVAVDRHLHGRLHSIGTKPHRFKSCPYTKDQFLVLVSDGIRGAMSNSTYDFITLKRWALEFGIDIPDRRSTRNHLVVMVLSEGEELPVYDLTIEGEENFVVNEIGVHNCSEPNMQNIPARENPIYRRFFVASPGHVLQVADVEQQEPWFSAILSYDEVLGKELMDGVDLHQITADLFGVKRDKGKAINLGLNYGMSEYGLADQVGISVEAAQAGIRARERRYRQMTAWRHDVVRRGRMDCRVNTVSGRPIWLNPYVEGWERNAYNAPVQGSAADHTKAALAANHRLCAEAGVPFRVTMVIHDEVVQDVPIEQAGLYRGILERSWQEAGELLAPGMPIRYKVLEGESWSVKNV